jgi:predicted secreted protein|tara:strand:+ start:7623 stop:8042 length:420 start_codon:yes stop_codon:yes gene_type:complete
MATNLVAAYTGEAGSISYGGATVAAVRSFTVDNEAQTIESTAMGNPGNARSYLGGLTQWSGSMDVYQIDDDSEQTAMLAATQSGALAEIILYPSGSGKGISLTGDVIVTGHSLTSSFDGMVEGSISFQGTGALDRAVIS